MLFFGVRLFLIIPKNGRRKKNKNELISKKENCSKVNCFCLFFNLFVDIPLHSIDSIPLHCIPSIPFHSTPLHCIPSTPFHSIPSTLSFRVEGFCKYQCFYKCLRVFLCVYMFVQVFICFYRCCRIFTCC